MFRYLKMLLIIKKTEEKRLMFHYFKFAKFNLRLRMTYGYMNINYECQSTLLSDLRAFRNVPKLSSFPQIELSNRDKTGMMF